MLQRNHHILLMRGASVQGEWEDAVSADLTKYQECSWQRMRLPTTIVPVSYDLKLHTNMKVSLAVALTHLRCTRVLAEEFVLRLHEEDCRVSMGTACSTAAS